MEFMSHLVEDIRCGIYQELKREAKNREEWRAVPCGLLTTASVGGGRDCSNTV